MPLYICFRFTEIIDRVQDEDITIRHVGTLKDLPGQEIKEMNAAAEINEDYSDIPKALADLMKINGVSRFEIQDVVSFRGYYPSATPIKNYDPGFVQDVLVKAWDAVFDMIKERRKLNF